MQTTEQENSQQQWPAGPAEDGNGQSLRMIKQQCVECARRSALEERARLIPDYRLANAALGIYDNNELESIRRTVNAFRNAVRDYCARVEKATSLRQLVIMRPRFPTRIL